MIINMIGTNTRKTFLCLALTVCVLAAMLCACGKQQDNSTSTYTDTSDTSLVDVPEVILTLAGEGAPAYRIIRGDNCAQSVTDACTKLRSAVKNAVGSAPGIGTDWTNPALPSTGESEYEILIGQTTRTESKEALVGLKYDDYVITIRGSKLVVVGGSDSATVAAVDVLIQTLVSGTTWNVSTRDCVTYSAEYPADSLTMLGRDVSEWYFTAERSVSDYLLEAARSWQKTIVKQTGIFPEIAAKADAPGAIILKTDTSHPTEWSLKPDGSNLLLTVGGRWSLDEAMTEIARLFSGCKGAAVLTAEQLTLSGEIATEARNARSSPDDIRIMSSNLLFTAPDLEGRMDRLAEIYRIFTPDVIGFQEMTKAVKDVMAVKISDQYTFAEPDTGGLLNCTQIAYRTDLYTCLAAGYERLIPEDYTKSISWVVLENRAGYRFAVTNIHCSLNPENNSTAEGNERRLGNARQMVDLVRRIRETYGDIDVFSPGDYFTGVTCPALTYLAEQGFRDPVDEATVSASVGVGTHHELGSMSLSSQLDKVLVSGKGFTTRIHRVVVNKLTTVASDHSPVFADIAVK